ncbi:MAG TPA: helix-turn-helix domain-containing protein [Roseiflexaceae bacterium]|nr:helix-turn-helix domain-containing protein [Roseiflexaceae bacterium]
MSQLPETDAIFSFGSWVSRRRQALRLTQHEVADRVGCSAVLIRKIEGDERRPSSHVAERLALALRISPEDVPDFIRAARAQQPVDRLPSPSRDTSLPQTPDIALTAGSPVIQLPVVLSSFVGRSAEIDEIHALLLRPDVRLLTLTGAGGSGKTRLALETAHTCHDAFRDGICFIDLAPITAAIQMPSAMMQALGISEDPHTTQRHSLIAWLRPRQILLIIDNFEYLLDAAPLLMDLLRAAPALKILVTSRVSLRLQGEWEYLVHPLPVPPASARLPHELNHSDAIRLLVIRAQNVRPDFMLTAANAAAVASICRRLDGLPLALELAAARLRIFSPQQLLGRLTDAGLMDLSGGMRDLPARQQTVHAMVEWSERLLMPNEQVFFARLGVFSGGWTFETAGAGAGDNGTGEKEMGALLVHNLVQRLDTDGNPRFGMLETVRVYALERLAAYGDTQVIRQRHARYMVQLAESTVTSFMDPPDSTGITILDTELENIRAVLRWAVSMGTSHAEQAHDAAEAITLGLRLMVATYLYWEIHAGRPEGHRWLEQLVDLARDVEPTLRIMATLALIELHKFFHAEDTWSLVEAIEHPIAETGNQQLLFIFHDYAAWVEVFLDRHEAALARWEAMLTRLPPDDLAWQAECHWGIGFAAYFLRRLDQGALHLQQSLRLSRACANQYLIAESLFWLGLNTIERGAHEHGRMLLEESLVVARRASNWRTVVQTLELLCDLTLMDGNRTEAELIIEEALRYIRLQGNTVSLQRLLYRQARLRLDDGDVEPAAALLAESLALGAPRSLPVWHPAVLLLLARTNLMRQAAMAARQYYRQLLETFPLDDDPLLGALVFEALGRWAGEMNDNLTAMQFAGVAMAFRAALSLPSLHPQQCFAYEPPDTTMDRIRMQEPALEAAWRAGYDISAQQAAGMALAWLDATPRYAPSATPRPSAGRP